MHAYRLPFASLIAAGLLLSVTLGGCRKDSPSPASPAPAPDTAPKIEPELTAVVPAPGAPAVALPAAPTAAELPIAASEVNALLEAWLAAQNAGDFNAYERLYAARMTGVRRTGPIVKQLSRAAWMADRRKMFVKQMQVSASDVQITSGITAGVLLTQYFATGSFSDVGPKRWVVVRQEGVVKIAREEMLASHLLDGAAPVEPPAAEQLALAMHAGDQVWLAVDLSDGVALAEAATGAAGQPLQLWGRQGPVTVSRAASWPESFRGWRDRDVVLYGVAGEVCRGQVQTAEVVAQILPHFGRVQSWAGEDGVPKASDREIAGEVWDQAGKTKVLAARIKPSRGDCREALWGRASNLAAPVVYDRAEMPAGALREAALRSARGLGRNMELQKEFIASVPPPRAALWDQHGGVKPQVVVLVGGESRLVLVHARAGDFCGGFGAELLTVWRAAELGKDEYRLQLVSDERGADMQLPMTAADVDGDGQAELIGPRQIWKRSGATWRPVWTLPLPDFDCPC